MIVAVLIAPFATATREEQAAVRRVQRALLASGRIPVWFPDVMTPLLNDNDPEEREFAIRASEAFVRFVAGCGGEAHLVGDRMTAGMVRDLRAWSEATSRAPSRHRL